MGGCGREGGSRAEPKNKIKKPPKKKSKSRGESGDVTRHAYSVDDCRAEGAAGVEGLQSNLPRKRVKSSPSEIFHFDIGLL